MIFFDVATSVAVEAYLINCTIQALPEIFFSTVCCFAMKITPRKTKAQLRVVVPWIVLGYVTLVSSAILQSLTGLTQNIIRDM